ncbi:MAG: TVP38/TMEM64 family protein [Nanoarchaeota archaeon]|nr:TVP38/TMEM64 family protein [Nanoarchaeota archaeon]
MKNEDGSKHWYYGLVAAFFVFVIFFIVDQFIDFSQLTDLVYLQQQLISYGGWSVLVFILVMALAIVVSPIPSLPLDVVAGLIWSPYLATVYAVTGALIGSLISFLLARWLGRRLVEKIFHKHIEFCHPSSDWSLALIIFVARLIPFIQFDIVSYGAGLTKMRVWPFVVATFFGMIPMTFIFASFGNMYMLSPLVTGVLSVLLVIALFVMPYYFYKYNLLGFAKRIKIEDTK